jgi:hypothetical protein
MAVRWDKLSRFAGVSEAGARRRNPDPAEREKESLKSNSRDISKEGTTWQCVGIS